MDQRERRNLIVRAERTRALAVETCELIRLERAARPGASELIEQRIEREHRRAIAPTSQGRALT